MAHRGQLLYLHRTPSRQHRNPPANHCLVQLFVSSSSAPGSGRWAILGLFQPFSLQFPNRNLDRMAQQAPRGTSNSQLCFHLFQGVLPDGSRCPGDMCVLSGDQLYTSGCVLFTTFCPLTTFMSYFSPTQGPRPTLKTASHSSWC